MTGTNGKPMMRDFDAFMRERISKYEPLERDDEPQGVSRLSREEIGQFFTKERAVFADRSAEQEQKSFEAFFARQNLHKERDTANNLNDLQRNPAFQQRSMDELQRLAQLRTVLTDSLNKKAVAPAQQKAMLEKFDGVYANPKALEKMDAEMGRSFDFTKTQEQNRSVDHEMTL